MDLIARRAILKLEGEAGTQHIEEYLDGRTERGKAMRLIDEDKFVLALMDASLSSTDEDTILDLVDACAENCKVYGSYGEPKEG